MDEPFKYICEDCDYSTTHRGDYRSHCNSIKHHKNTNNIEAIHCIQQQWTCDTCGKEYSHRPSLVRHKKTCKQIKFNIPEPQIQPVQGLTAEDIKMIMFQMFDMMKQCNNTNTTNNNTINNNNNGTINNNHFNLNFFLNEQCKDAMDINEFIDSIEVSLHDLEETSRLGYAEGISRIIVNNLKQLDIYKRPIHCSDAKRNVLYIRNLMQWMKDTEEHKVMKKVIDRVAMKNVAKINDWKNANPGCDEYDSRKRSTYLTIVQNAMSGATEEQQISNTNKVINNISIETSINKDKILKQ